MVNDFESTRDSPPIDPVSVETPVDPTPESLVLRYARLSRSYWNSSNSAIVLAGISAVLGVLLPPAFAPQGDTTFIVGVVMWSLVAILAGFAGGRSWRRRGPNRRAGMMIVSVLLLGVGSCFVYAYLREWSLACSTRKSIQCAVNLRMIGQALQVYQTDCGTFPPSLTTLIDAKQIEPEWTQCSYDERPIADGFDYKYVAGLSPEDPRHWIWAYEDPARHGPDGGGYILYLDAHVDRCQGEQFRQELTRFRQEVEATGREVVDEAGVLRVISAEP